MKFKYLFLLITSLLLSISAPAQSDSDKNDKRPAKISAKKGDVPAADSMSLTPGLARVFIRDLLQNRYLVSWSGMMFVEAITWTESKNIQVSRDSFSFEFDTLTKKGRQSHTFKLTFKDAEYFRPEGGNREGTFYLAWNRESARNTYNAEALAWKDEDAAKRFCDALNRLIYQAHAGSSSADGLVAFSKLVSNLRSDPSSIPPRPDDLERRRILAEQAIKDKDLISALFHYERAVEAYPPWAAGWFNAALLYAEFGEYEYAADRMKHYLELAPDAPDAKAAREKVIIWEDKARQ
jgi:tetratricopeptide (TPR) repeat protein